MSYLVQFLKPIKKQKQLLKAAGLEQKTKQLLNILMENPYQNPPPYEHLRGNLSQYYSRRINYQHRLVYSVNEAEKKVLVVSMWSHYETV